MIILNDIERDKFAAYLKQEVLTANGMQQQMQKMSIPEVVQKKYKTEIAACMIVVDMLTGGEKVTITL